LSEVGSALRGVSARRFTTHVGRFDKKKRTISRLRLSGGQLVAKDSILGSLVRFVRQGRFSLLRADDPVSSQHIEVFNLT
jgi:hypothetical protein